MLPPGLHSQYSRQVGVNVKLMKLQILKTFLFASVLSACVTSFALDPRVKYNKISSEHFDIIYDAKSYDLAKIYLEEAERSYQILVDVFGIAPKKTVVVLDDTLDLANGSAMGYPRPTVNIYVNPPTPLATIDYYSSWPRDVFLHEYAHILNMEPARGVFKPLRFIFGSFIRPNMFLPRWYLEGLAVEMESRFNEHGRLKSTDYDSLIRSLYLDSKWGGESISEINEVSTPYWPSGQRPYFYGALLWHELIQTKSISIVRTFNERYAGRMPWFISAPMVDELGKNYQDFLDDVYKKYENIAKSQILKIQEQPITQGQPILTKDSLFNHSPEVSPDGEKLLFVSQNLNGDSVLYVLKRLNDKWVPINALNPKEIDTTVPLSEVEKTEMQRASWFPDSQKIIFDSVDTFDRVNFYYDLYTYDLNTKKTKRLTRGLRAREPAVSPDGKSIVYVKAGRGKTALYTVTSEGKNETVLYIPDGYERVSRPHFVSAREIVFSQKGKNGKDRLHVFNLDSKKVTRILDYQAKYPITTPQGIVFASNHSGVENLYLANTDFTSIRPLTNSVTRVINGTIDPKTNKMIYSELTGDGPQIKQAPIENIKILPPVAHSIKAEFPEKIVEEAPKLEAKEKSYNPLPYMFPQSWMPFVSFAEDGVIASISIPGSDPTGFHSYVLQGVYDSRPDKFNGHAVYLWQNSLGQKTIFAFSDYYKWYASLDEATKSQLAMIAHGFYVPGLSNDWTANLGYEYKMASIFENISGNTTKRNHYFDGPSVGITYNNMEQKAMDISPHGQKMVLKHTQYFENTNKTDYAETFLKLSHYHTKWLPDRHVLALSAQASVSEDNRNILLGTTSSETEFTLGPLSEGFITRGYPAGEFIGYTMASGTLEYRFPLSERWSGPRDTTPFFIKRLHGSVFGETLTLKGRYFDEDDLARRVDLGKYFTTVGVELKADSTLFYHVPVTLKLLLAYGLRDEAQGGFNYYLTFIAPELF